MDRCVRDGRRAQRREWAGHPRTSKGESLLASSFALLSRGRVAYLRIRTTRPTIGGQPEYLHVTALDRRSRPLAGVSVELFNGLSDFQRTTNRRGATTFAVTGFGAQDLLIHAQGAFKPVHLVWRQVRPTLFNMIGIILARARRASHDRLALIIQTALVGPLTAKVWICRVDHGPCKRALQYGSARATAAISRTATVLIKPSPAAARTLRHHRRVRIQIVATLRPVLEHAVTATFIVSITL
jgi:hypothetical protein